MRPKVGDIVHVLGCRFSSGTHYMQEYQLVEIARDHIKLKHLRNITKDGEQPGRGEVSKERLEMLDYLSTPFRERWQKHIEDVNWICEKLIGKDDK